MKIHENFPDYVIYENGDVYSNISNKFLKSHITTNGYKQITLRSKSFELIRIRLHRLVAEAYIPNLENKREVNHIDCNKLNNNVSNLEWVSSKENKRHAWENKLYKDIEEDHCHATLTNDQVHAICKMLEDGAQSFEVISTFGINKDIVANIKNGRNWRTISSQYNIKRKRKERRSLKTVHSICNMLQDKRSIDEICQCFPDVPRREIQRIKNRGTQLKVSCNYIF